jgi:hypothetical protein
MTNMLSQFGRSRFGCPETARCDFHEAVADESADSCFLQLSIPLGMELGLGYQVVGK